MTEGGVLDDDGSISDAECVPPVCHHSKENGESSLVSPFAGSFNQHSCSRFLNCCMVFCELIGSAVPCLRYRMRSVFPHLHKSLFHSVKSHL